MKNLLQLVKTTALGGAVFLVPLVVAGVLVTKALLALRQLAAPFAGIVPTDTPFGVLLVDLALFGLLLLICFLGGLVARSEFGRGIGERLEQGLLNSIPGYAFIKGVTESVARSESTSSSSMPGVWPSLW